MKSWKVVILFLIVSLTISGCASSENDILKQDNENLQNRILSLTKEKNSLEARLNDIEEKLNEKQWIPSVTYCDYDFENRLVLSQLDVHLYPGKKAPVIGNIHSNTLIRVIDSGLLENEDRDVWLYIEFPVYDTPMNNRGWVKEKDTSELTEENREQVRRNIVVRKGTSIFETFSYSDIINTEQTKLTYDVSGRFEEEVEGYVHVFCAGGLDFWVEKKFIEFPKIEDTNDN